MLDIEEQVVNEWLKLGDTSKIETVNPFFNRTQQQIENPAEHILDIMRTPEYFGFTCKWLFNKTLHPFQLAILYELWHRPFPLLIGCRGMGKTFIEAVYALLRAIFVPGSKIVIVGAGFRQAKYVFEYAEGIFNESPVLQDLLKSGKNSNNGPRRDVDRCVFRCGHSVITAIPLGDGQKIRGQRANVLIAEEFASLPRDIYENAVEPFAAVSMAPMEKVQHLARVKAMKRLGLWSEEQEALDGAGFLANQSIISGSAYYSFNHFCAYWQKWKAIIESKGDQKKLEEVFGGEVGEKFNWKDYSVIRMPVERLPEGFMDEKNIAKARATQSLTNFLCEYSAVFPMDSNGFFKRVLIESCVVGKPQSPISHLSCGEIVFSTALRGNDKYSYVFGIDPASERDFFCIKILELRPDHRRIVFSWITTRQGHKEKVKKGTAKEKDFYGYVARKIRDLMILFPCEAIAMDSQGGGIAVMESLHDPDKMNPGEVPIWPVIEEGVEKDTDSMPGNHIVHLVNFASADWVEQANHGMKKDFEDKALLFPAFDSIAIGVAIEQDKASGRVVDGDSGGEKLYDSLEDAMMSIEATKDELASIVHTQTPNGRDRWDTPEIKIAGGKKGRLRKDRYSALLMANMVARTLARRPKNIPQEVYGGFAHELVSQTGRPRSVSTHQNPSWYTERMTPGFGASVTR